MQPDLFSDVLLAERDTDRLRLNRYIAFAEEYTSLIGTKDLRAVNTGINARTRMDIQFPRPLADADVETLLKEQLMQKLQMQMLGAFAEWQARVKQMNTKEGIPARQQEDNYHHGRPPLGFEKTDGSLIEGENYDRICGVLDMVAKEDLSKRKVARELDTSRTTISRALDRKRLYGL